MYHFEHADGHINFNSDLSGEVQIVNSRGKEFWVSGVMLVNFVAAYIEDHLLPRMEEAQARFKAADIPRVVPDYICQKLVKEIEQLGDAEFSKAIACSDPTTPEVGDHSSTEHSPT
jgi:hypothetical protein